MVLIFRLSQSSITMTQEKVNIVTMGYDNTNLLTNSPSIKQIYNVNKKKNYLLLETSFLLIKRKKDKKDIYIYIYHLPLQ